MSAELTPAFKEMFNTIANRMEEDRYIVVWDTPDGCIEHEAYKSGSSLAILIGDILGNRHADSKNVELVQKGPMHKNEYMVIAKKGIKKDMPFVVEEGVMTTDSLFVAKRKNNSSLQPHLSRNVPSHILRELAKSVGIHWDCQENLVLDSSVQNNELKYLKNIEWNLHDASCSGEPNCGPFLVFDKEKAVPVVIFYALEDVKGGEELLTMSNLPLQID